MKAAMFLSSLTLVSVAVAGPRSIRLPLTDGKHQVKVHVGDTLVFNTTFDQSASTGYVWRGPKLSGGIFGTPSTKFIKDKSYKGVKPTPNAPVVPGAPIHTGDSFSLVKVTKAGRGTIMYVFSRFPL